MLLNKSERLIKLMIVVWGEYRALSRGLLATWVLSL